MAVSLQRSGHNRPTFFSNRVLIPITALALSILALLPIGYIGYYYLGLSAKNANILTFAATNHISGLIYSIAVFLVINRIKRNRYMAQLPSLPALAAPLVPLPWTAFISGNIKEEIEKATHEKVYTPLEKLQFVQDAQICEIIPGLFLANEKAVMSEETMQEQGITHVLCCLPETPNKQGAEKTHFYFPDKFTYHRMPLPPGESLSNTKRLKAALPEAFEFIEYALNTHGKVVVHCDKNSGSRSSTVIIAYLMDKYSVSFDHAHNFVSHKRFIYKWDFTKLSPGPQL